MSKKFYFLAGLPRCGGTLITAILNQNPNIFVSPMSPLLNSMGNVYNSFFETSNLDYPRNEDIGNMIENLPEAFYKKYSQNIIIDKNFGWVNILPYQILEHHLKNDVKIICPVRPVIEILASFNSLSEKPENSHRDLLVNSKITEDMPLPDKRAKFIMENESNDVNQFFSGVNNIISSNKIDTLHFVNYHNLIENPKETINKIYDFLGEPRFDHNYDLIDQPFDFKDAFGYSNLHKVESTIVKRSTKPEDIFTPETIAKYSQLDSWINL